MANLELHFQPLTTKTNQLQIRAFCKANRSPLKRQNTNKLLPPAKSAIIDKTEKLVEPSMKSQPNESMLETTTEAESHCLFQARVFFSQTRSGKKACKNVGQKNRK